MAKQKKEKWLYKLLRPEEVDALRAKPTEELLKEHLAQTKMVQAVAKLKKDDSQLNEIKKRVKDHREASDDLKKAKEAIKEVREAVDSEIEEDIEDKKALEGGYRDQQKGHKETLHAIQSIIDKRNNV